MTLAVGLIAFITGVALLAVGLFLPDPLAAMAIPRLAVSRAATAGRGVSQGAPMVTNDPHLRFATMARSRVTVATMNEHSHVAQPGPGMGSRDFAPKGTAPAPVRGPEHRERPPWGGTHLRGSA